MVSNNDEFNGTNNHLWNGLYKPRESLINQKTFYSGILRKDMLLSVAKQNFVTEEQLINNYESMIARVGPVEGMFLRKIIRVGPSDTSLPEDVLREITLRELNDERTREPNTLSQDASFGKKYAKNRTLFDLEREVYDLSEYYSGQKKSSDKLISTNKDIKERNIIKDELKSLDENTKGKKSYECSKMSEIHTVFDSMFGPSKEQLDIANLVNSLTGTMASAGAFVRAFDIYRKTHTITPLNMMFDKHELTPEVYKAFISFLQTPSITYSFGTRKTI